MCNIIFFDYYRNAIKEKYEIEKNGEYSNNLNPPSIANLRNLCIKRFKSISDENDLDFFTSFFEFEFDSSKKNLIKGTDLNKFRAIGDFFKGETDKPTEDTIHFAAILLDFQPRPFNKFRRVMEGKTENEIIDELRNNYFKKDNEQLKLNDDYDLTLDSTKEGIREKVNNDIDDHQDDFGLENKPIKNEETFTEGLKKKLRLIIISIIVVFGLGFIISRYFFPSEQCMQWSGDHYEKVDCNLKVNGLITSNIEPYDEIKFELKKVNVCDTTTCFINGKPIIWYAKTNNGADFFNTHGIHPENEKALRPITDYIFNKYKGDCKTKKSGSAN